MKKLKEKAKDFRAVHTLYHMAEGVISCFNPSFHVEGNASESFSAHYCYGLFMRHLIELHRSGMKNVPQIVAEIGPGQSLGFGLCFMLWGAKEYYALDVFPYTDTEKNIKVFLELVELFRNNASIPEFEEKPVDGKFRRIYPVINNFDFPHEILTNAWKEKALSSANIDRIIQAIQNVENDHDQGIDYKIKYIVPWLNYAKDFPCFDVVVSSSVLEHVDDLDKTFEILGNKVKKGGYMSHFVGVGSHGFTKEWNGLWGWSDITWKIIRGKRPYLMNREPISTYLSLLDKNGFTIMHRSIEQYDVPFSIKRSQLKGRFKNLSEDDFTTQGMYFTVKKS